MTNVPLAKGDSPPTAGGGSNNDAVAVDEVGHTVTRVVPAVHNLRP
jgi:hypothetical protein